MPPLRAPSTTKALPPPPSPSSTISGRGSVPSLSSSPLSRGAPLSEHHLPPSLSSSTINDRGAIPLPLRAPSTLEVPPPSLSPISSSSSRPINKGAHQRQRPSL
ncbi:hypothetical protein ZIOFF_030265 [Zingiber officinale]|uniref:Uncharacterized protein n=1 Tax=Zingiber officinale TaxID=94328 RepID=A0A8J5L4S8_ZINOF|nr:hypothetical protein ZIOFF_030265 [Zingiber officinale]